MERLVSEIGRLNRASTLDLSTDKIAVHQPDNTISSALLSDITAYGSNAEIICTSDDWESKAASVTSTEITLKDNTTYFLCEPTTLTKTIVWGAGTGIVDTTISNNVITSTADPVYKATNLTRCRLQNVQTNGNFTNAMFDMTSTLAPAGGFFSIELCVFALAASFGTLDGIQPVFNGVAAVLVGGNLRLTGNGGLCSIVSVNWFNSTNFTQFTLDGTWTGAVLLARMNLSTGSSGIAIDVDSAISAPDIFLETIAYTGGTFFDPTGLDDTDIPLDVANVQGVADSAAIGVMCFINNTTATTYTAQAADGVITTVADAGGGNITITSTAHGLSGSDEVVILGTTSYNGTYTIVSTTTNTFDVTATFVATETGTWEFGWTDIAGTAVAGETLERFTLATSPNRLTYNDSPPIKATLVTSVAATNGSSGIVHEFGLFGERAGATAGFVRVADGLWQGEFDNRVKSIAFAPSHKVLQNDVLKVMVRNTEGTDSITITFFEFNIR